MYNASSFGILLDEHDLSALSICKTSDAVQLFEDYWDT